MRRLNRSLRTRPDEIIQRVAYETFRRVMAMLTTFRKKALRTASKSNRAWSFLSAAILVVGLILVVLILPQLLIGARELTLSPKEQLEAEASLRSSLIQILGGVVLVAGLYFTARGFQLTREGHITERYAKAIEQLGNPNADVRIGGIYGLERIARDSKTDRETVVEVLTTFVREHTRSGHQVPADAKAEADVQAAITVIARRPNADTETLWLDFYHSGLNGVDFRSGDFKHAMFYYSRLDNASFSGANLEEAGLSFCRARGAAFTRSIARGANFVNAEYVNGWFLAADLADADFYGCDLSGSDFGRRYAEEGSPPLPPAVVTNASFTRAKLKETNLRGVDLRTVRGLTPEQLAEAITDNNTRMPEHWGGDDAEDLIAGDSQNNRKE